MKKLVFLLLVVAGLVAAVAVIRKRRSDLELEEWDRLGVDERTSGLGAAAADTVSGATA